MRQPLYGPDKLRLMQSQHAAILTAVREGKPEEAVAHTRAHIHEIRDAVAAALSSEGH
jgi:DNA-binding GntR family transcriptional regulator